MGKTGVELDRATQPAGWVSEDEMTKREEEMLSSSSTVANRQGWPSRHLLGYPVTQILRTDDQTTSCLSTTRYLTRVMS